MAGDVLNLLLRLNLVGGAAIVLTLLLRKPLRRLVGARAAYALWLIAPLAAAASLLPRPAVKVPLAVGLPEMTFHLGAAQPAAATVSVPFDWSAPLLSLWLAGAVLGLGLIAWKHGRFVASLGRLTRRLDGALTAQISVGPAVLGTLHPRIIVPADFETRFEPAEQMVVLAHEKAHLRAGDAQINAFLVLCQCLCWFNPLVHIAAFHVRLDQELACDAAVMARYPEARRSYAEAMLKTQLAPASLPLGCYWPARSAHPLKERLAMLKFSPPPPARRLAGACAIVLIAAGSAYTAWAAQPPARSQQPSAQIAIVMDAAKPTVVAAAAPLQPPAPAPRRQGAPASAPAPADVCLSNACSTPAGIATAPTGPTGAPVAAGAGAPFAARFNAEAPVLVKGKVAEVRRDNGELTMVVTMADGLKWRVIGGPANKFPEGLDRALQGSDVVIRGYQSWNTNCTDGCEMNGRDVTFADGRKIFVGATGTGAPKDGTDATER